ncbi:AfsR family transcriptional regulator [Nocardioides sp. PD653]|nr:AfsR family transcriptional regulator [Nocardioides sp. PD653-B2]GAW57291.1 AfsR family transcriptional regulator [Nocardioides sp. PD653]
MVAHPPDEEREAAGGLVVEGGHDLGDIERGLAEVHEAYDGSHAATLDHGDHDPRTVEA